ncbi:MAG TPA: SAM-dependent methyltransferase [Pyrinomonadaceae bacterium]|jgi:methyltransferase (TIGR00027 family)
MKTNQGSATAYLIAESAVYLADNKTLASLIEPQTVALSEYFAGARPLTQKLIFLAKRRRFFRPVFDALEKLIIPGIQLHYLVRKRRLEEIARAAIGDGFSQIVVLGAGFDTLALRLHGDYPNINFIEIDHPATLAEKRRVIESRRLARENLRFVPLDLAEKSFAEALSGDRVFQKRAKTLFIAEGLLMYLEPEEVKKIFAFVREQGAPESRFAFTFMERGQDGRVHFRNSSKFVDLWLQKKGEPFRWGLKPGELESFLAPENFSLQSLDSAETFRQRYLSASELENLPLAEGESLCVAASGKAEPVFVNDIHSKLNKTRVAEIVKPQSVAEIQTTILRAQAENKFIAVAGGFHAMGGQQFLTDGVLLDMSGMTRVLRFEPQNELIEVESGIRWNALIEYLVTAQAGKKHQVGIRQKQTGADNLSLGGAISANIHGRGLRLKPFIEDVESFRMVDARGEIRNCSRHENAELFRLVIGGYGLFGIVASVCLRLTKRRKLRRVVRIETVENLDALVRARIAERFLYGDFQFAINALSDDFLKKGVFSCYREAADETPVVAAAHELAADDWKKLLYLAHVDKQTAFDLYAAHYMKTDGQIYFSDTHQLATYLDDYHTPLDSELNATVAGSEMITEVYVPMEKLNAFLSAVREDFRARETDLIYGTIRFIRRDSESFLAWAREDFACIVFNLHIAHRAEKIEKAAGDFRLLIDRALSLGGSFYLTYHRWATKEQVLAAYPQMPEFLELKKKFDSDELFQSDWYGHYKRLLS